MTSGQVEQQHFGPSALFQRHSGYVLELRRIPAGERLLIDRDVSANHVNVCAPAGWKLVLRALAAVEEACIHVRILKYRH